MRPGSLSIFIGLIFMSMMTFSYLAERAADYTPVQRKSQFRKPVNSGSSSIVSRAVPNKSTSGVWLVIDA